MVLESLAGWGHELKSNLLKGGYIWDHGVMKGMLGVQTMAHIASYVTPIFTIMI